MNTKPKEKMRLTIELADNGIMLCHKCHKEIHCNPWKNIEMMKAKAEELGIDLKERYDYDDGAGE